MDRKKLLKPIGKLCREARKEYGCSVKQMAEILNVSKNAVYRFERGHYDTSSFLMFYILYFDVGLDAEHIFMEAKNDE